MGAQKTRSLWFPRWAFFAISYRPWPNDYPARVSRRRFSALGKPPACAGGSCSCDRIPAYRLTWTLVPPALGPLMRAPSPLETTLTQSESLPL
jgi:hypothetical protein